MICRLPKILILSFPSSAFRQSTTLPRPDLKFFVDSKVLPIPLLGNDSGQDFHFCKSKENYRCIVYLKGKGGFVYPRPSLPDACKKIIQVYIVFHSTLFQLSSLWSCSSPSSCILISSSAAVTVVYSTTDQSLQSLIVCLLRLLWTGLPTSSLLTLGQREYSFRKVICFVGHLIFITLSLQDHVSKIVPKVWVTYQAMHSVAEMLSSKYECKQ